ncbi:hypothetical protein AWENTII_005878 [Aspergillus wentii]|nr:hypothetical protein MW887_000226 [Aspergillus wentii]
MPAEDGPRKRRRPAKSCEQCRQRKVRCDRNIPCAPCTRSRTGPRCSYRDASPSPQLEQPASGNHCPVQVVAQPTLNHLTPTSLGDTPHPSVAGRHQSVYSFSQPTSPAHSEASLQDIKRRLQSLDERLSRCETSSQSAHPGLDHALRDLSERVLHIEQEVSASSRVETQDQGLSISGMPPRLHTTANKMKLLGPTHWIHTTDKLQVIDTLNTKGSEPSYRELKADLANLVAECRGHRQVIKSQQSITLNEPVPDLHSTIPPRSVCDELVNCYLRTFELIYRVIHVPSFWKEYNQFWEQPQSTSTSFLIKLVLILAIGTAFYPGRDNPINDEYTHLAQKWIYAGQWWLTGPSEKSTFNLDGVQVLCLLLIARKVGALGPSQWLSTGSLTKMAMAVGLHRDPGNFPSLSVFQSEMRVRLWATVLELALQSSLESATPLSISDFDTRAPLNINDEDISPDTATAVLPRPTGTPTETSIPLLLHESVRLRMKAIQYITKHHRQSYQQALQLGGELRNACRKLAAFFHSTNPQHSNQDTSPNDFHRKFLDIEIRRYILALHTPFKIQARKDPQYYYSRKVCLESAMVIASYADGLNLPSNILDDFSRLTILGRGSFKGPLGLEITSILGLEIITQLEEEAPAQQPLSHPIPDPLDELAKVSRAPLIRSLKHIRAQLLQVIKLGSPSTRRYHFVAAMLSQIRAMESGECIKRVVYESIKQSSKECFALMQASTARGSASTPDLSVGVVPSLADPALSRFDMDFADCLFDLDLPSLLSFTGMDDINKASF